MYTLTPTARLKGSTANKKKIGTWKGAGWAGSAKATDDSTQKWNRAVVRNERVSFVGAGVSRLHRPIALYIICPQTCNIKSAKFRPS